MHTSAKQKEQLALISTTGFAAAIGSHLFIGLYLDVQVPKSTAIICGIICLVGFSLLASANEEELTSIFLPAWILLSLGGSGMHFYMISFLKYFRRWWKEESISGNICSIWCICCHISYHASLKSVRLDRFTVNDNILSGRGMSRSLEQLYDSAMVKGKKGRNLLAKL